MELKVSYFPRTREIFSQLIHFFHYHNSSVGPPSHAKVMKHKIFQQRNKQWLNLCLKGNLPLTTILHKIRSIVLTGGQCRMQTKMKCAEGILNRKNNH